MHLKHLLFACLLGTVLQASAQQAFNGYYINTDGDTTAVSFPGYKQWKNNPAQIDARTTGGQALVLTPENAREVAIEDYDTYRSRRFTRLLNPSENMGNYNSLPSADSTEEVHGFLLFLTKAKGVNLYKYRDKTRANFFIEKGDSLEELKHKIYLRDNSEVLDDNTFRQQLAQAFQLDESTNPALNGAVKRLEYHEEKLEAFVRQMGAQKVRKEKMYPAEIVLLGGMAINTFTMESRDARSPFPMPQYNTTFSPVLALAIYDYSQRGFGRNFFTVQLKYYRFKNTGTFTYENRENKVTHQASNINLGVGVGRHFVKNRALTAYAAILPHMVFLPDSKEEFTDPHALHRLAMFSFNAALQAGVRLPGGLGVWAHYNLLPLDTQDNPLYDQRHRSFQLGVDFKLRRQR